jgi:hypothetical protein
MMLVHSLAVAAILIMQPGRAPDHAAEGAEQVAATVGTGSGLPTTLVEWSCGVRDLGDLIDSLSVRAGHPYVLAGGLTSREFRSKVRVPEFRGPAYQAVLIAAELGGLDVLFSDGLIVWLPRGGRPITLTAAQQSTLQDRIALDGLDEDALLRRRATLDLEDATLNHAASTIALAFAVPVVLSDQARSTQALITAGGEEQSLAEVLLQITDSTDVVSTIRTGVVWLTAASDRPEVGLAVADEHGEFHVEWSGASAAEVWTSVGGSEGLGVKAGGLSPADAGPIDAAGTAGDVREAFLLIRGAAAAGPQGG